MTWMASRAVADLSMPSRVSMVRSSLAAGVEFPIFRWQPMVDSPIATCFSFM